MTDVIINLRTELSFQSNNFKKMTKWLKSRLVTDQVENKLVFCLIFTIADHY